MAVRKFSIFSFPALRITLAVYVPAALATLEPVAAFGVLFFVLPVLGYELAAHRVCEWVGLSVRARRCIMLAPAILLAGFLFRETNAFLWGRRDALLRQALGGCLPARIENVQIWERTSMTGDWWMNACFRTTSDELHQLVSQPAWTKFDFPHPYRSTNSEFTILRRLAVITNGVWYQRSMSYGGRCDLITDPGHTLVFVNYASPLPPRH
jgi:hypothetical protein